MQLAKPDTERAHQIALFAYCAVAKVYGWHEADRWNETSSYPQATGDLNKLIQRVPELHWLHAIPNGGSRGDSAQSRAIRGGQLKAEGVRQGVADLFLPVPCGQWHGLYIEMKAPSKRAKRSGKGGLSAEQVEFASYASSVGYGWVVCYNWREAADILKQYINYAKV
jgi:hypothetical protein